MSCKGTLVMLLGGKTVSCEGTLVTGTAVGIPQVVVRLESADLKNDKIRFEIR